MMHLGKMSKEVWRRMEEANTETVTQALWEDRSLGEGGLGLLSSPLSVPESQIHSWCRLQKMWQWLAMKPSPPNPFTTMPELLGAAPPHGWGQASVVTPPSPCSQVEAKNIYNNTTKRFPRTQCAFTTKIHLSLFSVFSMSAFGLAVQLLVVRADTNIFFKGAMEYVMPPNHPPPLHILTHNSCTHTNPS